MTEREEMIDLLVSWLGAEPSDFEYMDDDELRELAVECHGGELDEEEPERA